MLEFEERQATVTKKGQVTIPVRIREMLGLKDGGPIVFRIDEGNISVRSGKKAKLSELLASFDSEQHRHGLDERHWDDAPVGREQI